MPIGNARYTNVIHFRYASMLLHLSSPSQRAGGEVNLPFRQISKIAIMNQHKDPANQAEHKPKQVIKPLRFNSEEWAVIQENMQLQGYKMFGRFAKSQLLKKKYGSKKDVMKREEYQIIGQLSRIGNNINQIARQLNSIDSPTLLNSDRRVLIEIRNLLINNQDILKAMLNGKL
jgi:hypothetical protein